MVTKKKSIFDTIEKGAKQVGFTLMETLISLLLVLIGVLFVTRVIMFSLDLNKKSRLRLKLWQQANNQIHTLLSKPFDSDILVPGNHSTQEDLLKIKWKVKPVTPTLKRIDISIVYKQLTREEYFYKSKTIKSIPDL
jgi:Tfp pilus assembly protein PilV